MKTDALGDPLMEILVRLRESYCIGVEEQFGEALSSEADRFAATLAVHRRQAEERLFPSLRALKPGSACDFDGLEDDHRHLHLQARDLALHIRGMDNAEAYGLTRSVLASLLDHVRREGEEVDRFIGCVDATVKEQA